MFVNETKERPSDISLNGLDVGTIKQKDIYIFNNFIREIHTKCRIQYLQNYNTYNNLYIPKMQDTNGTINPMQGVCKYPIKRKDISWSVFAGFQGFVIGGCRTYFQKIKKLQIVN